ncbi:MAG: hypothetical protein NXY59_01530 [Aigarchaeota archaeon]|nr:hypothetical protein [Candidatus Pelearchaeum maunauluense]
MRACIMSIDIEDIIKRAVTAARTEELRMMAEAVKSLAEYMRDGFQKINQRLEENSKILAEHSNS